MFKHASFVLDHEQAAAAAEGSACAKLRGWVPCRRPDGSMYAIQKRLQEEMCRQFYDAAALPIIVLRPDGMPPPND